MKKQIIKHSKHQFIEGDVEHWWHEETGRGIRTRFSDDLLWLPYMVAEYIKFTGDWSILNEETEYVKGAVLERRHRRKIRPVFGDGAKKQYLSTLYKSN